ncbi:hypothetical protein AB833_16550 [Chromatiales bacterium (ex Bugula neritina AB1)]|nr:hypothetical protein AB833_16550 [Chromatiales bacterium (ex Bugula neritina AB1)]
MVSTKLHTIAHSRSGDKGNRSNLSLICYQMDHYPYVQQQITEGRVLELFAHKGASNVTRYELPNLLAFNYVIDDVLEGGVNDSLCLDSHGKTLSSLLLGLTIELPTL